MELIKESLNIGEILFSDNFEAIADGDLIVPDVKPDILKILQVNATSCISSKEISDGRLTISGRADITVLYLPDKEDMGVQSIRTSYDFTHKCEKSVIDENCYATVVSDISKVDFHVINSRKLSLKAIVSIDCEIISAKEISFLTALEGENVHTKTQTHDFNTLSVMRDFDFFIKDAIEIPSGKASIGEILNIDYRICDKEFKMISEKVVVKGVLAVCVLYTDCDGKIEYTEAELPFTEVFDLPETDENSTCEINFCTCDCYFDTSEDSDGDRRIINLEISVCAEIKASTTRSIETITDLFCPGNDTEITKSEKSLNRVICSPTAKNTLRENITIDSSLPKIERLYNVITHAFITKTRLERDKLFIEGKVIAYILYIADNPPIYSHKAEIPFSYALDCSGACEGMDCAISCEAGHTSFHLNSSIEVEIRCILGISANISDRHDISVIEDVNFQPIPKERKKGLVIYFVKPGDTLWNIAKNYSVSPEQIAEFNKLSDKNSISPGQKLVIPTLCKAINK